MSSDSVFSKVGAGIPEFIPNVKYPQDTCVCPRKGLRNYPLPPALLCFWLEQHRLIATVALPRLSLWPEPCLSLFFYVKYKLIIL